MNFDDRSMQMKLVMKTEL